MKTIITNSLKWFHENKRSAINGFVIMLNHVHFLWQPLNSDSTQLYSLEELYKAEEMNERDFLSFTGHQFKKKLQQLDPVTLEEFRSTQNNKEYHFWERRSRSIEVTSRKIAEQKLDYIHHNPCQPKWKLCTIPDEYEFSSAKFYETNRDNFGWLTYYYELT